MSAQDKGAAEICLDDVTASLRLEAFEMERKQAENPYERLGGDPDRLRAKADYIDRLLNAHASLQAQVEKLEAALAYLINAFDATPDRNGILHDVPKALAHARAALAALSASRGGK